MLPRSTITGIAWPALPDAHTASLLALLWQLEQSQWWPAEELRAHQRRQLAAIFAHAASTVPHYQKTLAGRCADEAVPAGGVVGLADTDEAQAKAGSPEQAAWRRVPILTRAEVIAARAELLSRRYPAQHGDAHETVSSRSTGEPVRIRVSGVVSTFWQAMTLRDHGWHRRDLSGRLGAIRYLGTAVPDAQGSRGAGWGPSTAGLAPDAPLSVLSLATTTEQQVEWLLREDPAYLLVYPTVLGAMLRLLLRGKERPRALRQVRTVSEALSPDTRQLCAEVLGVPLVDSYSAQEVGYLALQCPDHPHYHVQSERLLVEILDEQGLPCRPGQVGRVVVTDLHNFATPLVRYELGDYAEVGAPCPCGRGLPVLARITGRRRGMLTYPDGRTVWPMFAVACREAAPYRELQVVQESIDELRMRVVPMPGRALDEGQRAALARALQETLGHPFGVTVEEVGEIGRSAAGKLEEFVSKCR
jgi:phenylacetate-CoA ligase